MAHRFIFCLFVVILARPAAAQDLGIGAGDLRIEQRVDGGFHLFIRKKPDISSVLLVESTKDPRMREDNYAYRAGRRNEVNGDEIRILNGARLPNDRYWSIIDSTPERHPELGEAFHLYIPYLIYYGYEDTRHGEVYVVDGTYFNLRAFNLPYGDYRGPFRDNPYVLRVTQKPLEGRPEDNYMDDTVDAFTDIARSGGGDLVYSSGPEDLVEKIRELLDREKGKDVDIVLCLDTTSSMRDDIDKVRRALIPMLEGTIAEFTAFRIGVVLYKDYYEEYLNRVVPFTADFASFQRTLNGIRVGGGRDIPEAVYEALYEGAVKFPWSAESRIMILVGDAPPHARPRAKISKAMVDEEVAARGIKVNAIILPQ
ncbi:MAG: VWA domain-containing protein [Treponema sp.]|jgi:Mg-chelatase subunit ChlD|nr:VWA domain-containing protein [Treponema sp.]